MGAGVLRMQSMVGHEDRKVRGQHRTEPRHRGAEVGKDFFFFFFYVAQQELWDSQYW